MCLRHVSLALILLCSAHAAFAADATATEAAPSDDLQRMTPEQIRAEKDQLSQEIQTQREANAEARRRIEALEQRNAELAARKAELDARLAELQAQLARLEAARDE